MPPRLCHRPMGELVRVLYSVRRRDHKGESPCGHGRRAVWRRTMPTYVHVGFLWNQGMLCRLCRLHLEQLVCLRGFMQQ